MVGGWCGRVGGWQLPVTEAVSGQAGSTLAGGVSSCWCAPLTLPSPPLPSSHCLPPQKRALIERIAEHSLMLSQDPFGNYVVQYVLELGHPETSAMVMTNLKGHYGELATQKFRWGLWSGPWSARSSRHGSTCAAGAERSSA